MSFFRRIIRPNSWIAQKGKYILFFLNGFLLALLMYFFIEKQYENSIFTSMANYVKSSLADTSSLNKDLTEDSILIKSVHLIHNFGKDRLAVFGSYNVDGIKGGLIQPVSVDLATAQGACGSYAYSLARLLQQMDIEVRIPQMTVSSQSAGHIIVEAKTSKGWVVLDALSDAYFTKPNGQLAGFNDVENNWAYYSQQLPVDYNMAYRYEGVRYTNWDKIPVIMPLIKNIMYWTMGKEKTDGFSLRTLGLKKYNIFFNITLGAYLLVVLFSINLFIKRRRKLTSRLSYTEEEKVVTPA
jgi:hypothetical protein